MSIVAIGIGLIIAAMCIDALALSQAIHEFKQGKHCSTTPFISLIFSVPGSIMIMLYMRWGSSTNITAAIGVLFVLNVVVHLIVPVIYSRLGGPPKG